MNIYIHMWWLYLVGVLIGYLLGKYYLFQKDYHGPNSKDIINTIYQTPDGQYWQFLPEVTVCPLDTGFFPSRLDCKTED